MRRAVLLGQTRIAQGGSRFSRAGKVVGIVAGRDIAFCMQRRKLRVGAVMTCQVVVTSPWTSLRQADIRYLNALDGLPVIEVRKLVGVIWRRDRHRSGVPTQEFQRDRQIQG